MLDSFLNHIDKNFPFLNESKLLIAISGGMDSVVLTHLCHKLGLNFALAHCNFKLRGQESDHDESFVLKLAKELDVEVFVESFETEAFANENKMSIQMAARELRYDWFLDLAEQLQFDFILTAHHADDDLETFLINMSRGTGLEGLTGIPEANGSIIRPLLLFSRTEIEGYAINNKLDWREDSSNASNKYVRNRLRHDVIPVLKEINPKLLQNYQNTQRNLKDSQHIIDDAIVRVQNIVVTVEDNMIKLNIKKLKKLSHVSAYLYELLKDFNFKAWNDIVDLLEAQSGKQVLSETHRIIKDRKYLLLTELTTEVIGRISISEHEKQIEFPMGTLFFDEADTIFGKRSEMIYVDKNKLEFPLTLRHWQEGDYFYPLGMTGKKKLSKYFKDEKMSLLDKENAWLLCSNDEVVWVVNRRADNRFKVNENTKQVLKIELQ
ncbi:tRNA lysidine(34) synthetase TilS [Flavobacteriales bacterium 34_180_T64]|nr:tRNA lysidine(34) synthetase TilS [Flavobacteriales bacterium 34_180_T64]